MSFAPGSDAVRHGIDGESDGAGQLDGWMRSAIEFSAIGTALLDVTGRVVYVNEACTEILGRSRAQLVGNRLTELVHPEDRTIELAELIALDRGEVRSLTNEWRLTVGSATVEWVRTHLSQVRVAGSEVSYVVQLEDVTERCRLAAQLQQSERRAHATLDALEEGVLLADASGVVLRMNPAAERLLGYDAAQLTDCWQRRDWDTFDEVGNLLPIEQRPLYRAAVLGERVSGDRVMWRRATGELMLVRVSCIPNEPEIAANHGRGLVVTFTDITEERRTERLLEATLETAPAGLALVDAERGSIIHCNPAFAHQVGRDVEHLVGHDLFALLDPAEHGEVQAWAAGLLSGVASVGQREQRVKRPDGTEVELHATLALIDQLEEPVFIAATFDMTERREMEFELARFGHLFERTNDLISVIGVDGIVRYATPSHERVLGLSLAEHPGADIFEFLHPDDAALCRQHVFSLLNGAESAGPFVVRIEGGDGAFRTLECVAVNLLDEPSVGGVLFTSRDATEREELMAQLEHRAAHDLLTELPNRMLYERHLHEALARSERSGGRIGLCFVDLDDFKGVNDTLGHQAGDEVLVEVARRLRSLTRDGDIAARIGGDEFVVVLDPVRDLDDARAAGRRIRDALVDPPILVVDGLYFGASIGVAVSRPGEVADRLQSRADRALYRAKERPICSAELSSDPSHL